MMVIYNFLNLLQEIVCPNDWIKLKKLLTKGRKCITFKLGIITIIKNDREGLDGCTQYLMIL